MPEEELHAAIASAVNMTYANRDDIIPVLKENIESVVGCDVDEEIEVIDNMIRKSQMDLLDAGKDEARIQEIGERIGFSARKAAGRSHAGGFEKRQDRQNKGYDSIHRGTDRRGGIQRRSRPQHDRKGRHS